MRYPLSFYREACANMLLLQQDFAHPAHDPSRMAARMTKEPA
jgi:hypothetical protein